MSHMCRTGLGFIVLMMISLGGSPSGAQEGTWYETGNVLMPPAPVLVDSETDGTTVTYHIPDYGPGVSVGTPTFKSCQKFRDDGRPEWAGLGQVLPGQTEMPQPKPILDKYLVAVGLPTNYLTGDYTFVFGDLSPTPRRQWVCPRLPFVRAYQP